VKILNWAATVKVGKLQFLFFRGKYPEKLIFRTFSAAAFLKTNIE